MSKTGIYTCENAYLYGLHRRCRYNTIASLKLYNAIRMNSYGELRTGLFRQLWIGCKEGPREDGLIWIEQGKGSVR